MIASDIMALPTEMITGSANEMEGTVLVIDDELGPRESLRFLLKTQYEVHCADCVDSGVELLKKVNPDVVIMDIKMPGKTGIQGLREIRAVDSLVSVVMLTGFATVETAQEAIRLGANDYVKKPFNTAEMRETVKKYAELTAISRKKTHAAKEIDELNSKLKKELEEKERLASLGQASSEFVHDLRNPLSVIHGYCQLLSEELAEVQTDSPKARESLDYLSCIERSVERCREMSELWRDLGKKDPSRMKACSVVAILEDLVDHSSTLAQSAGGIITLDKSGPDCSVIADRIQLFRAFQNLVGNAVQALPEEDGVVRISWEINADRVSISISDNGCGIPEDRLDGVFEPYSTTRQGIGGMGLGLFISKKVIETHGGTIRLTNNKGAGATGIVDLPLA